MSFEIILADKDNADHEVAIRRLWDDNLRFIAAGRYEWLYEGNPAGETITCLAVKKGTGEIVGMASAMRRNFYMNGRCYTAGIAIDFAIDEKYRVFGPALNLQRELAERAWEHGVDFMLGFPNLAAQGIIKRLGYERIGENLRFSKPIRTRVKLASILSKHNLPAFLTVPVAFTLDAGLLLRNMWGFWSGTTQVFSSLEECGEQWQQMWKKSLTAGGFQGERGSEYISWRYLQCPYKDYRVFGVFDNKRILVAYIVYVIEGGIALIDDFQYMDRKWLLLLFRHYWKAMRAERCSTISTGLVVNGTIRDIMTKAGFFTRQSKRWGAVLSNPHLNLNWTDILGQGDWYLTDGEIDL